MTDKILCLKKHPGDKYLKIEDKKISKLNFNNIAVLYVFEKATNSTINNSTEIQATATPVFTVPPKRLVGLK